MQEAKLPLEGIRVLDLTTSYSGPFCTMFLGDMGANVVKIEEPQKGDDSRYWGPPFFKGVSPWFLSVNRNKKSASLNIQKKEGTDILRRLLRKADVFVVSLAVGALEKLALTYDSVKDLNPALVYCSITGYGHQGPYKYRPCYDLISEGIGGIMAVTGDNDQPQKVGTAAGDILAAHQACFSIVACLYRRTFTGLGDFIDISLVDSVVSFITPRIVSYLSTGELPKPDGNRSTPIAVYQPLKTKDGYLNVAIGNDRIWERVCKLLGLSELLEVDAFKTNESRKINRSEIVSKMERVLLSKDTHDWFEYLSENGVPCGPINYLDSVVNDPHIRSRGMFFSLRHDELGMVPQVGSPWKLSRTEERKHECPPQIGQHDEEVYGEWLEMGRQDLEKLRKAEVIR